MLTNKEVFAELQEFLTSYAESMSRIYGDALPVPADLEPARSRLWSTVDLAFRFGVEGTLSLADFNLGLAHHSLHPDVTDADMFFHGLSAMQMRPFMDEDLVRFPGKCAKVIDIAIARHVLHGGQRDITWDAELPADGYLTIGEVALLANMDEGSVRNAATKAAGQVRLVTEQFGKRSFVEISAARDWLASRKGFVPTFELGAVKPVPSLSAKTLHALADRAEAAGLSIDDFVRHSMLAA